MRGFFEIKTFQTRNLEPRIHACRHEYDDADDNTLERYRVRVPFSRSLSKAPFGSAPRGPTC
jgi:hypothetical protein